MKKPWMKFFPADWRADDAVRSCSLAARGLWIEMLCIMHQAEPRGRLVIGNSPVTSRQLASICGSSLKETNLLLKELEAAGVFSRDGEIVFSRRMLRDEEKAAEDKANGSLGGNPKLMGGVNQDDKAHKLEAREPERKKGAAGAAIASVQSGAVIRTGDPMELEKPVHGPPANLEKDLFERGKAVLGSSAGGLVKKLLKSKQNNLALARAAIEQASTKADPREYLGAIIRQRENELPGLRAGYGDDWG